MIPALRKFLKTRNPKIDPECLANTPGRFLGAFNELTSGYDSDPKAILSKVFDVVYDEMVIVKNIPFWSLCEHHLLPFSGTATVGYIPKEKVVGLSKIPRLVECFARRFQVQERLTRDIASAMDMNLYPRGVGVLVRGYHTCMAMRGIKSTGEMVTSCLMGVIREKPEARQEFLELARTK
jgi:GTP cyclohydrolase I